MATLASSTLFLHQSLPHPRSRKITISAIAIMPMPIPNLSTRNLIEDMSTINRTNSTYKIPIEKTSNSLAVATFYAIIEAVADRVEMHKNIGEQRDNWNRLLLTSVNAMTLTAVTMTGLAAAVSATGEPILALKLSSTLLYASVTGVLAMMNKIQPSQLAEEQRNASRLFKQLHFELQNKVSLVDVDMDDVNEAMEKVLALDKAYLLNK